MSSKLNPYINFKNSARQAMEFYKNVFGGKLVMTSFKEFGMSHNPGDDNLIMHGLLEADNGITLMGADTPDGMEYKPGTNVSVSLSGENEAELRGYWRSLPWAVPSRYPLSRPPGATPLVC